MPGELREIGVIALVRTSGSAYERGREYGANASGPVAATLSMYKGVFEEVAGLDWRTVASRALSFEPIIGAFRPSYLDELQGIADGAGVDYADIMAINLRTEIMLSAVAARAESVGGCSAFALSSAATTNGHTTIGQNWDWCPVAMDNLIVLEAIQEDAPNYLTVVEAGLLAKMGMNSEGVGVVTNTLISGEDAGEQGVPYHVLLRAVLDCSDAESAVALVRGATRSSSANFLIADANDHVIDVETGPGSRQRSRAILPTDGRLCHTNHFTEHDLDIDDVMVTYGPNSFDRLRRLSHLMKESPQMSRSTIEKALRDHLNEPGSVCQHIDSSRPRYEQAQTLASVIIDLEDKVMWLAEGPPCAADFEVVHTSDGWLA